jgi:hypothetical protein
MNAVNHVMRSVAASSDERRRTLAGDDMIDIAAGSLTHAITIHARPAAVWPWLVQMGAGTRGGWYSYDALDNGRRPSATTVIAELQHIFIGIVFPALPGETSGFTVLSFAPERSLVLGWLGRDLRPIVTWAFVLEPHDEYATRLIVRVRAARGYRFRGLPPWLSVAVARVVHFVMVRKQLLGIAGRVEYARDASLAGTVHAPLGKASL